MPMSNPLHLAPVIHFACAVNALKILDIGVGMGTYGFLLRQYLDISKERLSRTEWKTRIDGIEIFKGYQNPVWSYAYDNIIMSDIRKVIDEIESYDLILCNDVLEHFEIDEARLLIAKLLEKTSMLIATTPNKEYPQGQWGENAAEEHHCLLRASDFPNLISAKVAGVTTCYVCSNNKSLIPIIQSAAYSCPTPKVEVIPYIVGRIDRKIRNVFKHKNKPSGNA